jgi:ABC-type transport system substrate-binding protein
MARRNFVSGWSAPRLAAATGMLAVALMAATPGHATTARVHLNADIRSINPGVNRDDNTDAVVLHMVEGLVAYGEDSQVKPLLAEKIAISDDGLTYTFTLRKGVKFHNGAELDLGRRGLELEPLHGPEDGLALPVRVRRTRHGSRSRL